MRRRTCIAVNNGKTKATKETQKAQLSITCHCYCCSQEVSVFTIAGFSVSRDDREVDLKPEDCDTQPLPRKLRLLMDTSTQTSNKHKAATTTSPNPAVLDIKGSDVIKDEIHATHVQKKLPSVHTASAARKR